MIANPKAGNNRAVDVAKKALDFLQKKGLDCQLVETTLDQNAQKVTEQHLTDDHTDLLVVGGDGTVNEAVNGMGSHTPALSILSSGTGNDFIKNIELGNNIDEQLDTALNGQLIDIDLGLCNRRKFLNGVGLGFDGQIVRDMLHRKTWLTGHAAYYYHVLRILASYQERTFEFSLDNNPHQKDLILMTIGNGTTFGGGFKLTPDAKLDDGLLDVCLIGAISAARRFLNVPRLSNGTHLKLKEIEVIQTKTLEIKENPLLEGHIDGEYLGKPPFSISLLPKALKVRVRK
ncbi:MAG: diacylglycerol kinase family lipid kinase [Cytophagales bacterium]|nr:diacylglycerol kinase family lipid kinase [Cytophagales bacterium]